MVSLTGLLAKRGTPPSSTGRTRRIRHKRPSATGPSALPNGAKAPAGAGKQEARASVPGPPATPAGVERQKWTSYAVRVTVRVTDDVFSADEACAPEVR